MGQTFIPAVFYRGGTSKGVFFHARDLPAEREACDPILLAALGSPDPYGRQLNGMGGGISSLSKAVIIGPPTRPDADVDYTFVQLAVDEVVRVRTQLEEILARHTGRSVAELRNDTDRDRVFDAAGTVEYGLADLVLEQR